MREIVNALTIANNKNLLIVINTDSLSNDSIIASGPGGWWVYTFFVILRDGKLVGREGVG